MIRVFYFTVNVVLLLCCHGFIPDFSRIPAIQLTSINPWPSKMSEDNLCRATTVNKKLDVIIVMGSDKDYLRRVNLFSAQHRDPLTVNTRYANKYGYALRMYVDEEIPFLMKYRGMIFRKWFLINDCLDYTKGLKYGYFTTKAMYTLEDLKMRTPLVMWVDGDAFFLPIGKLKTSMLHKLTKHHRSNKLFDSLKTLTDSSSKHHVSLSIEEVVNRTCARAEFPNNYVRVIGQDSGNNVNGGWYLVNGGLFGLRLSSYMLELGQIYSPCGVWDQNIAQEALLVVMAGTNPFQWPYVLPCSGERYQCFTENDESEILKYCEQHVDKSDVTWQSDHEVNRTCLLHHAAVFTRNHQNNSLSHNAGSLNECFSQVKYGMAPNSESNWQRAQDSIAFQTMKAKEMKQKDINQTSSNRSLNTGGSSSSLVSHSNLATHRSKCGVDLCCKPNTFNTPICNSRFLSKMASNNSNTTGIIQHDPSSPQLYPRLPDDQPFAWWSASGAGVVLLADNDPYVKFNTFKFKSLLLWHKGHKLIFDETNNAAMKKQKITFYQLLAGDTILEKEDDSFRSLHIWVLSLVILNASILLLFGLRYFGFGRFFLFLSAKIPYRNKQNKDQSPTKHET